MRIVGFLRIKDEVESGHLERFIVRNSELFDKIYAVDDCSQDGTPEMLEAHGAIVIRLRQTNFLRENSSKQLLLQTIQASEPEGTTVFWLDADEVCYATRGELEAVVSEAYALGFDSVSFQHLNLWRSDCHFRLDDQFNSLKPTRVWRLSSKLKFETRGGLHQQTHPAGLASTMHCVDYPTFHYGFVQVEQILKKQAHYFLNWQRGYALDRLTNEIGLETCHVLEYAGYLGSRYFHDGVLCSKPAPISTLEWRLMALQEQDKALSRQKVKVSIVCLIFQSTVWLEFAYGEMLRLQRTYALGEVELLFVANDPTEEVVDYLLENQIPHVVFKGKVSPEEWYINSVYRAYNHGVSLAKGEYVYLINSDMAFEQSALRNVMDHAISDQFITSRLVERGKLASGLHAVEKDFGANPNNLRRDDFLRYADSLIEHTSYPGGLYMPLLASRQTFLGLGGFPSGNVRSSDLQLYLDGCEVSPAEKGDDLVPGDYAFFEKARLSGVRHETRFDSVAYHFQEGELRDRRGGRAPSGLMIANDLIQGVNGEETVWGRLRKTFPSKRADLTTSIQEKRRGPLLNELLAPLALALRLARAQIKEMPRAVFSNATYAFPIPVSRKSRRVVLLQDRPKSVPLRFLQALSVTFSDTCITNDLDYWGGNLRKNVRWAPIGFRAANVEKKMRDLGEPPKGIFVGALNSTKGVETLFRVISDNPGLRWEIVTKLKEDLLPENSDFRNVRLHHKLQQDSLFKLMAECDFLVCCSPHETQHLASLEAASIGLPVFTTPTGLLGSSSLGAAPWGMVSSEEDFLVNFKLFLQNLESFDPKRWIERLEFIQDSQLEFIVSEVLRDTFVQGKRPFIAQVFLRRGLSFLLNVWRFTLRYRVIPFAKRLSGRGRRQ